jgi:hypothetical protein
MVDASGIGAVADVPCDCQRNQDSLLLNSAAYRALPRLAHPASHIDPSHLLFLVQQLSLLWLVVHLQPWA